MEKTKKIGFIERIGRFLPESNILFLILIGILIVVSFFLQGNYTGADGITTYQVKNLLSVEGIRWILYNFINNFRAYPPLGIVIVGVIGFGFAEKVGLLGTLIKKIGHSTPDKFILPVIILIGINSSIASDAGYVVLIPLAGALYAGLGRNPLVGIAAAFAGVSAGFGAAFIPTPGDGLLGNISEKVVEDIMGKEFLFNPVTMNLIFMFVSTIFLTVLITFVTKKFVEPKADHYDITIPNEGQIEIGKLTTEESKGLKSSLVALIIVICTFVALYFLGPLQSFVNEAGDLKNPLLDNIIVIMIALFLFPSLAFGITTNKVKNSKDYIEITTNSMKDMAYILVFAVFAGNFLAIFSFSGISNYIAHNGALLLINLNIQNDILLIIAFIIICAFINLFMGSASAKWVLLAPIFIVMLDSVSGGSLSADYVQLAYRIADSSTNIITPLMSYMGIILLTAKKYAPKFEVANLISIMMPYSWSILIGWSTFFIIWMVLGLPIGI
ncbi:MAG: AbgT family transporter [Erysipelotrichaceae bacterium]